MPRRKTEHVTETDESGAPVAAATRPDGWSEEAWSKASEIGTVLGNISLAMALMDVTSGKRAPADDRETSALTEAARKLEARSYRRYTSLRDGIGRKLATAKQENLAYVDMLSALRVMEDTPDAFVSKNGYHEPRDPVGDAALEKIANSDVSSHLIQADESDI